MRTQWLQDHGHLPEQQRHPEWANFDPAIPLLPTTACGISLGDAVSIHLHSLQARGVVAAISTDTKATRGTKLYPMFYVRVGETAGTWVGRSALRAAGEPLYGAPPLSSGES